MWDALLAQDRVITDAMTIDLVWVGRQLLGDLFLVEKQKFDHACKQNDKGAAFACSDMMIELLSDLEDLNTHHPHATLAHWLEQARELGKTHQVKDYYEMNARRLITTWGGSLNDYACRNWSGLMWDYYAKRWEIYIREAISALLASQEFNDKAYRTAIDKLQTRWATSTEKEYQGPLDEDVLTHSRYLRDKYRQQLNTMPRKPVTGQ